MSNIREEIENTILKETMDSFITGALTSKLANLIADRLERLQVLEGHLDADDCYEGQFAPLETIRSLIDELKGKDE